MIREAVAADVPSIVDVERACFADDAWSAGLVAAEVEASFRRALVVVEGEQVVGWAATSVVGDLADLDRIAVAPRSRRHGHARLLLADQLADARERGAERMLLEVAAGNAGALALYAGAGFAEISRRRRYYRDGSDAVVMSLPLRV